MTRATCGDRVQASLVLATLSVVLLWSLPVICARAQTPQTISVPAKVADVMLETAQAQVGRALIQRGFPVGNEFMYDQNGHLVSTGTNAGKSSDWTLAGVTVESAERRGADSILLRGLRTAIRYNPDQHIFERHPIKQEKLEIQVTVTADPRQFEAALSRIFSIGIDPALERSVPDLWRHYFLPAEEWPVDSLTGQTIYGANNKFPPGIQIPVLESMKDPESTPEARQDQVKGMQELRIVVDANGVPRRISVRTPLGYGLDERCERVVEQYRFRPAMLEGKPVAVEMLLNQIFDLFKPL